MIFVKANYEGWSSRGAKWLRYCTARAMHLPQTVCFAIRVKYKGYNKDQLFELSVSATKGVAIRATVKAKDQA